MTRNIPLAITMIICGTILGEAIVLHLAAHPQGRSHDQDRNLHRGGPGDRYRQRAANAGGVSPFFRDMAQPS